MIREELRGRHSIRISNNETYFIFLLSFCAFGEKGCVLGHTGQGLFLDMLRGPWTNRDQTRVSLRQNQACT